MRRLVLLLPIALLTGCGSRAPETPASPSPSPAAAAPYFRNATKETGVTFVHAQSQGGQVLYLPETLGPGTASLDFDGDGLPDLFFVQGSGDTDGKDPATIPRCALFRNGGPGQRFAEVDAESGADLKSWGQSCLAFDANNDGYQDLVVTGYQEPVRLLVNQGDGTFRPAPKSAGLPGGDRWWTFATAIDLERDGLLDLYVGSYVKFGPKDWNADPPRIEFSGMMLPMTMAPSPYFADANAFLANRGDGRFEDRTQALRMADTNGRSLAALSADLDLDGWPDLFVANDVSPCVLFRNLGGKVEDVAARAWVAESRGSMGLALGDVNRDGLPDIGCSHWVGDLPAVYQANRSASGRVAYRDVATELGLAGLPRDRVGWAITMRDLDHDGHDDFLIVNGHTSYTTWKGKLVPQAASFLTGQPSGRLKYFVAPQGEPPPPLAATRVGRSGAFADLDNDGFVDLAVGNNNGPAEVWMNVGGPGRWIGVELVGTSANRDAVGARVTLTAGPLRREDQVTSGESFFASNDPRRVFSLGRAAGPCTVTVRWPSGVTESFAGLADSRYHRLVESTGKKP